MTVLDTNVLSPLMLETPDAKVVAWLDRQPRTSVWTTAITVLEIRFGLQIMTAGKRRERLMEAFDKLLDTIGRRIAGFDTAAAERTSDLMTVRHKSGRSGNLRDAMIGGIVLSQNATLATRNTAHFSDLSAVINPWTE